MNKETPEAKAQAEAEHIARVRRQHQSSHPKETVSDGTPVDIVVNPEDLQDSGIYIEQADGTFTDAANDKYANTPKRAIKLNRAAVEDILRARAKKANDDVARIRKGPHDVFITDPNAPGYVAPAKYDGTPDPRVAAVTQEELDARRTMPQSSFRDAKEVQAAKETAAKEARLQESAAAAKAAAEKKPVK